MDFAFVGLTVAAMGLLGRAVIGGVIFKRVHGMNINKFLDSKVLEKRMKINKTETETEAK